MTKRRTSSRKKPRRSRVTFYVKPKGKRRKKVSFLARR